MAVVGAFALGLLACAADGRTGGDGGEPGDPAELSGRIAVERSDALGSLVGAATESFVAEHPDVTFAVGQSATSEGFDRLCAGAVDLLYASRPISAAERRACRRGDVSLDAIPVAYDAVAVTTHQSLPIECLTVAQLEALWREGSRVSNYADLDVELPNQRVSLYGPLPGSAPFELFVDVLGGAGAQRADVRPLASGEDLAEGMSSDKGALGYLASAYFEQNRDRLDLVAIDAGDGCVEPSLATIQGGAYEPMSRPIRLYRNERAMGRPEVRALLEHVTRDHLRIAQDSMTVPISREQAQRTFRRLQSGE